MHGGGIECFTSVQGQNLTSEMNSGESALGHKRKYRDPALFVWFRRSRWELSLSNHRFRRRANALEEQLRNWAQGAILQGENRYRPRVNAQINW